MTAGARAPVAIVTGGAGGIGRACAERLSRDGQRVVVFETSAALVGELEADHAGIVGMVVDVADRGALTGAVDAVVARIGPPTALVNCAGIYRASRALDVVDDDFDAMFAVNVRGTFLASQIVARAMAAAAGGSIVNLSSVAGAEATAENVAYAATKGAVDALTRGLAVSLAPHGIRVNAVAPGPVATDMGIAATKDHRYRDRMLSRVLVGGFAEPSDVAGAVAFLLSDDASHVTGHVLPVDGGVLAHR